MASASSNSFRHGMAHGSPRPQNQTGASAASGYDASDEGTGVRSAFLRRFHAGRFEDARMTDLLPDHVRKLVAEIETEIGESDEAALAAPIEGSGSRRANGRGAAIPAGRVEEAVRDILAEIGEDPTREGLAGTPDRVHRMYAELTAGYHVDPDRLVNSAIYEVDYSEMVVVKDIPFYSLCEHHLLPFFGTASVAYIPRGQVIGLSKIPRIVEMFARRLQVQERLTQQIADFLNERLNPLGVGVVVEANHLCAVMRGIRKPGTVMTTSAVLGLFRSRDRTRAEFFSHLERRSPIG
jgi:GTP cyclohydrolase I